MWGGSGEADVGFCCEALSTCCIHAWEGRGQRSVEGEEVDGLVEAVRAHLFPACPMRAVTRVPSPPRDNAVPPCDLAVTLGSDLLPTHPRLGGEQRPLADRTHRRPCVFM